MQKANRTRSPIVPVLGALLVLTPSTGAYGQQGLSGVEIAQLAGTTTSQRASIICTLAPRARENLSAQETAIALGDLSGVYRLKALTCLAPHVQANLTGSEAAQIVGAGQNFRADMACRIADHVRPNLSSTEGDTILDELIGVYRLKALKCLEPRLGHNLTGTELAQVVGDKLSFRRDMLCAISSHAQADMASDQLALALGGLSGVYRLQAIKCLEPSTARGLTGQDLARAVGPGQSFRKDMLCALANHTSGVMPAHDLSMALGALTGVYRLQAIQCLDRNALAVTDRLSPGENPLRVDPEPRDASGDSGLSGGATMDEASSLYRRLRAGDVATTREVLSAARQLARVHGYNSIADPLLRDKLVQKAGATFLLETVVDAFIEVVVEEMDANGAFGSGCPFGAFCDRYVMTSFLRTGKNLLLLDIRSQIFDQVYLIAESWQETKVAIDNLPCIETLPAEEQERVRDLYRIKAWIGSRSPVSCQRAW